MEQKKIMYADLFKLFEIKIFVNMLKNTENVKNVKANAL